MSVAVFNEKQDGLNFYCKEDLSNIFWNWNKCYGCDLCWDVKSITWDIKDSIVECLWQQAWVWYIWLGDTCGWFSPKKKELIS